MSYYKRRERLSLDAKAREKRVANSVGRAYREGKFKTLRELKEIIETQGVRYRFRDLGYATLSQLNQTLETYGLEAVKVGRGASENLLKKYGLRSTRD